MSFKTLIIFFLAVLYVHASTGQALNKAKMDSLFDVLAAHDKVMVSIAITRNGSPLYSRATGYSQWTATRKTLATPQTHYRIGSISKMFTAVMIFQLIQEGRLKLSTTLDRFFPELPNAGKISVAHLLNHSSGLHNFTNDSTYFSMLGKHMSQADMLAIFKTNSDFDPGGKHEYSNTNFVLLGYMIEKLDKKTYADALTTRITGKAGLQDTYYGSRIDPAKQEAFSYTWMSSWQPDTETDMSIPGGAGAIVSTPSDLTKFLNALFAGRLIHDSSLAHMKEIRDGYGMAMFAYPFNQKTGFGHNGGIDGFRSQAIYFPGEQIAVSYTANGVNTDLNTMMIGVLSIVFGRPYTIPSYNSVLLKPEELDQYMGVYASTQLPIKITITKKDTLLMAQATNQQAFLLESTGQHEFRFNAAGLVMQFDPTNSRMTLKQGGGTYTFTKEK